MTEPLFFTDLGTVTPGDEVELSGAEGHHAQAVRRIRPGEIIWIGDGAGRAVRGTVLLAEKHTLRIAAAEVIEVKPPSTCYVGVQALAKTERAELAVEILTEAGVDEIIPWQSERSVAKWAPERIERGLARWRAAAREAAKQSRRLRVPLISPPHSLADIQQRIRDAELALVLHESAETSLAKVEIPTKGEILFVIGPEGGLSEAEVAAFAESGAQSVRISDGILRTSTAGVVALAAIKALQERE
ncbi:MAG: 16S rRNA (uracil(1498)-N(3))-methyltransferase [Propionibacteriaceae bacterium]|nr:16S rRNA (uracil(1498)-N(3))-methyltransferase [Propionibacteriaceae bacterium]